MLRSFFQQRTARQDSACQPAGEIEQVNGICAERSAAARWVTLPRLCGHRQMTDRYAQAMDRSYFSGCQSGVHFFHALLVFQRIPAQQNLVVWRPAQQSRVIRRKAQRF